MPDRPRLTPRSDASSRTPTPVRPKIVPARRKLLTPNPDGEEYDEATEEAMVLPPIYTSGRRYSQAERVALYCDQILGQCKAEDAEEILSKYLMGKLAAKRSWVGVWTANPGLFLVNQYEDISDVGVLVEVHGKPCQSKSLPLQVIVSIAEPFSSSVANLPRDLAEDVLTLQDHCVSLLDVYPIEASDPAVKDIAQALENARFFYDFLWRDWDEEEDCDDYTGLIEKRVQLHYDIEQGAVPGSIGDRFRRTLRKYKNKRLDLQEYQSSIKGNPSAGEAVECWKKHFEILMLRGLLKFWEDLNLRSYGPCLTRISKHRRQRDSGQVVTHIVAQMMTADMVQSFCADTLIQQHASLSAALSACFSGDTVLLFPGQYQAPALDCLADDIIIKGAGNRKDVVIVSDPSQYSFVASKAADVTLKSLTLVQCGTCDGAVVVECGHMTLEDCVLNCEGTGVCVLAGATLVLKNCEISSAQGAGVELYPGSVAELEGNNIHHCCNLSKKDILEPSLGGINIKVLPEPEVKMFNNHIHNNRGYGVAILMPENPHKAQKDGPEHLASGEKRETDPLSKALEKLNLEMITNKMESNTMGSFGVLHKDYV
ncbi:SHP1L protein, partial [Amia calva]|nr:SHP1L protein [Amia calva]